MNPLRHLSRMLVGGLTWLLVACGPGVGGTGTGYGDEPGLAGLLWAGAQAANVCDGPLAVPLQCAAVAGAPGTAAPGNLTLVGECATATIDGDQIVLDVLCGGWIFAGRWGIGSDAIGRYYGLIGSDPMAMPTEPGTVEVVVDGARIVMWLRDAQGALLAGPLPLTPAAGAAWRRSE